ncbi:FMN-dependent dehydrogenase [Annulohypoxylon maeteangense]|uniref:FMN-dependent dehydrogenase n=1 Tax=Annulohypoxylon maeteangense TaxID=1927788 RepID=UPI0020078D22|nr:FMN-dependent dehydrogenase [Annulohypoxylon maeteangense]KAI0883672.1 FMN-dependent dehydrogenase [Annulohypoxylon maeteangense]
MGSVTGIVDANLAPDSSKGALPTSVSLETDVRSQRKTFSAYQHTIYMNGVRDVLPNLTTNPNNWEAAAKAVMEPRDFDYAKGGAGAGETVQRNREAFQKWSIIPRMVRGNTERSLKVTILGQEWPSPVAIAPVGVNKIFHADGETGIARAAGTLGIPYALSTFASESPEDVAAAQDSTCKDGPAIRWLQLYWPQSVDQDVTRSILKRAKDAGYTALVITLDIFSMSWRPMDLDNAYLPLYKGASTALGFTDPVFRRKFRERYGHEVDDDVLKGALEWENTIFPDMAHSWHELEWLRQNWDGKILVKGIQHATDAELAVQAGVDGIIVSNHGGRQYDGAQGSLEALQEVALAVGDRTEVLFDSGIRTGADITKALALGAKAVFVGRPVVYGLGARGQEGALHVLRCLLADLEINLAITGVRNVTDLKPDMLRRNA